MPRPDPTPICLNMIVKNEAHVIRRCLDSVRAHVAHWVIVDTGSTDGTQDIVREHLRDLPGELHERPWRDFGSNRSEALTLARGRAPYVLVMDADNVLHTPPGYAFSDLHADGYWLKHRYAGVEYVLPLLLADRIDWRYEGVLHEFVTAAAPHSFALLEGPWIEQLHEGARSRDPETYRKDAETLEAALVKEPGNTRYLYYLAQSLRDAGETRRARDAFRRRAEMGGWDEEAWYARYQAALLDERLGESAATVQHAYLAAFQARPTRAEPLVELARFHRERQQFALALIYARQAARIPRPPDRLFVDEAVYAWRALDELAISGWYAGARDEGRVAAQRLLEENRFPDAQRARIEANLAFYDGSK